MKIVMFTPYYFPKIGGLEKHVKMVSEELIRRGHHVTIITRKYDESLCDDETVNGVKIIRYPNIKKLKKILWILKNRKMISDADIVHCHDFSIFLVMVLPYKIIFPFKSIFITFHGSEGKLPIPKKQIFYRKLTVRLTKRNLCIGDFIGKYYHFKPDLISYGGVTIPSADIKQKQVEENNSIVYVGRLEKDVGIMEYLEALKILKNKEKIEFTLNVCGDGSLRKKIEKFIEENNLKVILHGFVNPIPIIEKSKFAFVPNYLAILEAMAHTKLVFAIYHNQLKKDYLIMNQEWNNLIIVSSSPEDLVESLVYYIKNPKKANEKIINSFNFVKTQSWEKLTDKYLRLWNC